MARGLRFHTVRPLYPAGTRGILEDGEIPHDHCPNCSVAFRRRHECRVGLPAGQWVVYRRSGPTGRVTATPWIDTDVTGGLIDVVWPDGIGV